jgi:hypothetical protein
MKTPCACSDGEMSDGESGEKTVVAVAKSGYIINQQAKAQL